MKLEKGQQAPDFTGKDQNGNTIRLNDYRGKKVILYFYPKDDTPGCTAQACDLRDNYQLLQGRGYEVLGISSDSPASHQKFIGKYELPFTLIADEDKSIHEQFGTWVEKSMYGRKYMGTARVTFVIDENGTIEDIIEKVKTKEHTAQIVK
ncbi:thioredoxin-dependent thiol peroxidase [Cesiribacter andamanensis]|uniref:thioredoxin-dependent peroxiredoxin n=1 Tax=Cesiribacter andamanensis AMV16 TaxID=1279009 RepID=M7NXQ6_9BACT|nr:thioredoxin-dependent thiol peroxidase [Cesiribacter andamanensis]EMR03174.1 Putative peroxiredoxin bcp [Cesiribacter andamanensis AMV16]